ncbi:MAG: hypothetical protein ACRDUY_13745 [Nitriliruptorales bacterium]
MDWPSIIVGVVATAVVAIVVVYYQRRPKRLQYRTIMSTEVFDRSLVREGGLDVNYKGLPVVSARVFLTRVANTGKIAIRRDDFDGNLEIIFGDDNSRILAAKVAAHSESMPSFDFVDKEDVTYLPPRVVVPPLMLNPGDWFEVQAWVENAKESVKVSGRIAGVNAITVFQPEGRLDAYDVVGLAGLPVVLVMFLGGARLLGIQDLDEAGTLALIPLAAAMVVGAGMLWLSLRIGRWQDSRHPLKRRR